MNTEAKQDFIRRKARQNQADPEGAKVLWSRRSGKMTGELERNNRCPLCGGRLRPGVATIPFVFPDTVVLIKDVPAEICHSCHEPYVAGKVTDRITNLLNQLRAFRAEVSIISYSEPQPAPGTAGRVRGFTTGGVP